MYDKVVSYNWKFWIIEFMCFFLMVVSKRLINFRKMIGRFIRRLGSV